MDIPEYKSPAKNKLVEMLVNLKDVEEGDYTFFVKGDTHDAEKFVHRMRVELSRFRSVLDKKKQAAKPFKILIIEIVQHDKEHTKVTLRKSMQGIQAFNDVAEVFDLIGGGGKINV